LEAPRPKVITQRIAGTGGKLGQTGTASKELARDKQMRPTGLKAFAARIENK